MATDPVRLSRNARATFALATVAALAFMGIAAMIEVTNPGREYDNHPTEFVFRDGEYLAVQEVFWMGERMSGHWYAASTPGGPPDEVRLVAGSDVERILAGQEPEKVYKSFPPWSPGAWVGDVSFVVPGFNCSGPMGGCEPGDLPAIVFTRGDAWVGTSRSDLQPASESAFMPSVSLVQHAAWVLPALLWMVALATLSALVAVAAGLTWRVAARRLPKPVPPASQEPVPLEMSLHLVELSRLYLASIARSLYAGGTLLLLGGIAFQLWGVPRLDGLVEDHLPFGSEALETWLTATHWLIVPFGLVVAGIFWTRHLRELLREQRRWDSVASRLDSLAQRVLG